MKYVTDAMKAYIKKHSNDEELEKHYPAYTTETTNFDWYMQHRDDYVLVKFKDGIKPNHLRWDTEVTDDDELWPHDYIWIHYKFKYNGQTYYLIHDYEWEHRQDYKNSNDLEEVDLMTLMSKNIDCMSNEFKQQLRAIWDGYNKLSDIIRKYGFTPNEYAIYDDIGKEGLSEGYILTIIKESNDDIYYDYTEEGYM